MTRYIANYCHDNDIHTVVIGDIRNIRKGKDLGDSTNQKLHSLPYEKMYTMLEYKLQLYGIRMIRQNEAYSSQCGRHTKKVCYAEAEKENRVERGLYREGNEVYSADALGAYNILRKYLDENGKTADIPLAGICAPAVIQAAV